MPSAESTDAKSDDGSVVPSYFGSNVDAATFEQILEMDDDEEDREFSKSIVGDFFIQADQTFEKMAAALKEKDLQNLSALGHFLKGSSATLGLTKVKDSCEEIQHLGARMDATGEHKEPDDKKTLARIEVTISQAKAEYEAAEKLLRRFFGMEETNDEE